MIQKIVYKLKEKLNKMKKDDSGSAFIFVVIGVMFVSILGATVMSLATNYVTTVIVDHYSTDNFYQTEGYLDEVRSGIEELAGEVNEQAYLDVVEHYSSPKMTSKMKTVYGKKYLTGLVRKLNMNADGTEPSEPNIQTAEVESLEVTKATGWKSLGMNKIKKMSTNPDTLSSIESLKLADGTPRLEYRFTYDSDTEEMFLTIRGLVIEYEDETNYHSDVQTDIKIGVPDYGFEGNSTYDQLKHYVTISDDILFMDIPGGTSGAEVTGSIYAGKAKTPYSPANVDDQDSGIEITPESKVTFNSKQIISRGNLNIYSGSDVKMNGLKGIHSLGDLWLKNIVLRQPASATNRTSKVDIYDNSYILDDTSIEDDNSELNLAGNYYGYSYNEDNQSAAVPSMYSEYSSAILVNGKNTTLGTKTADGNELTKLILAGRTFVQRKTEGGLESAEDIMMGESLAVRSNQIAYLVPTEFIVDGHNPLSGTEVANVDDINAEVNLSQLLDLEVGGNKMSYYLNAMKPITANFDNSGNYVFLYLNFASEAKANEYFSNYYAQVDEFGQSANKEYLNDKAQAYISTTDVSGMKISPALYLIAGNIIHSYYESGGKELLPNYRPNSLLLNDSRSKMKNYLGLQLALVPSGSNGVADDDLRTELNSPSKELVSDVILNIDTNGTDRVDDNWFKKGSESLIDVDTTVPGHSDWKMIFSNENYTVSAGVKKGIILCAKDVTVSSEFEGLIIAGGKISITAGGSYKANVTMLGEILDIIKNSKDKDWWKYFRCLNNNEKNSVNVADCISYENWERNSK